MNLYVSAMTIAAFSVLSACGNNESASQAGAASTQENVPSDKQQSADRPDLGQDPSDAATTQSPTGAPYGSMLVESAEKLPTCDESREGALAYVKTEKTFYVCAGQWEEASIKGEKGEKGDAGDPGKSGLGITKVQSIQSDYEDYCTEYALEMCYFASGQVVRYADGSLMVTAVWKFQSLTISDFDTDSDYSTVTYVIPSDQRSMVQEITDLVARGGGYKTVFLVYSRDIDRFGLIYDNNESLDLDSNDVLLTNLTLVDR